MMCVAVVGSISVVVCVAVMVLFLVFVVYDSISVVVCVAVIVLLTVCVAVWDSVAVADSVAVVVFVIVEDSTSVSVSVALSVTGAALEELLQEQVQLLSFLDQICKTHKWQSSGHLRRVCAKQRKPKKI